MADGFGAWGTDIGHDGDAQPMKALKGGCGDAHTQMPMMGENSGPAQGAGNETTPEIAGWSGFLANSGGARGVGGNDNRSKTT